MITQGEYWSGVLVYPADTLMKWTSTTNWHEFLLTIFLANYDAGNSLQGNCVDASDLDCIVSNSIGANTSVLRCWDSKNKDTKTFLTSGIRLVGQSAYTQQAWNNHQFVFGSSGTVFDPTASFALDLNGYVYLNTPTDWSWTDYWQVQSGLGVFGLVASPASSPSPYLYQGLSGSDYVPSIS